MIKVIRNDQGDRCSCRLNRARELRFILKDVKGVYAVAFREN